MGRKKHCSEHTRQLIMKLRSEGKTYQFIQELLNCSAKMISNALRWREKKETRGRKKKTTVREDNLILRHTKMNPFIPATKLKLELNLNISARTIRRRLKENNLIARSPRKVPLLKRQHIKRRLQFAKDHLNWPTAKWRNILWTDESKIILFGSSGRRSYVRRPAGTAYQPQYTLKTVKHGGAKIMIWGCFSYYGTGPIHWIKDILTQHGYVEILENVMLPYAEEEMPLKWVLMQDNDPKHTSRRAKDWFIQNRIEVLEWPAQSPDLNPIENLWTDIKEAVFNENPRTQQELWEIVQTAWHSIPPERCRQLVDSMPRRCEAVLKNKGYATKY